MVSDGWCHTWRFHHGNRSTDDPPSRSLFLPAALTAAPRRVIKMLKIFRLAAASSALGLALLPATPASAQEQAMNHGGSASQPFVTLAEWTERLDGLLEQELVYPTPNYDREPDRGIVRVKFNCSESGR